MDALQLNALKKEGNQAHQRGDYRLAIYYFSKGLTEKEDYILYSNRSASYYLFGDMERAQADAEHVIRLNPTWGKGYSRKGAALEAQKKYGEAIEAFKQGLEYDPNNELMQKGLAEAEAKEQFARCKLFDASISDGTQELLRTAPTLNKLPEITWCLIVIKEKIWLDDPPHPAFRPRTVFLVDTVQLKLVHVHPHTTRDSITLDELLQFILQTALMHHVLPGTLQVPPNLKDVIHQPMQEVGVNLTSTKPASEVQQLIFDTTKQFEAQERERWANDSQYSGVLLQRSQQGLLSVADVTMGFLQQFYKAAAEFQRQQCHLYCRQLLGMRLENADGEYMLAHIFFNSPSHYGVALTRNVDNLDLTKKDDGKKEEDVMECCCIFAEGNCVPFSDVDLSEEHGLDVAGGKYPVPMLAKYTDLSVRPSLNELELLMVVFKVTTLLVKNLFGVPTFMPSSQGISTRIIVMKDSFPLSVVVTAPPSETRTPDCTIKEEKENQPAVIVPAVTPTTTPAGTDTPQTSSRETPSQQPPPKQDHLTHSTTTKQPQQSSQPPPATQPPPTASSPARSAPSTPLPYPPFPASPTSQSSAWRELQTRLPKLRGTWEEEQTSRQELLNSVSPFLLNPQQHNTRLREDIASQRTQLRDLQERYRLQTANMRTLQTITHSLEEKLQISDRENRLAHAKVMELEQANERLRKEIAQLSNVMVNDLSQTARAVADCVQRTMGHTSPTPPGSLPAPLACLEPMPPAPTPKAITSGGRRSSIMSSNASLGSTPPSFTSSATRSISADLQSPKKIARKSPRPHSVQSGRLSRRRDVPTRSGTPSHRSTAYGRTTPIAAMKDHTDSSVSADETISASEGEVASVGSHQRSLSNRMVSPGRSKGSSMHSISSQSIPLHHLNYNGSHISRTAPSPVGRLYGSHRKGDSLPSAEGSPWNFADQEQALIKQNHKLEPQNQPHQVLHGVHRGNTGKRVSDVVSQQYQFGSQLSSRLI